MRNEDGFLYEKLYHTLKEQIESGYVKPGEFLMPEHDMCRHYRLSRNSVRKALENLQKDGYVVKRPGLGTMVVAENRTDVPANHKVLRILAPSPAHAPEKVLPIMIKAFQQRFPHVEVKVLTLPTERYSESFLRCRDMGIQPDLVCISDLQFNAFKSVASFMDLSAGLPGMLSNMSPKLTAPFRAENGIVAVPMTFSPVFLAYNPGLFERMRLGTPDENWTFADFVRAADRLTLTKDGMIEQYGFSFYPDITRWIVLPLQNGFKPDMDRHAIPIFRHSLTVLQDLMFRKRQGTIYLEVSRAGNPFIHEKSAMVLTTSMEVSGWKEQGISFTPQFAPASFGATKANLFVANALMIPADCGEAELAQAFIRTALSPEVQREMCKATPFLSILQSIWETEEERRRLGAIGIGIENLENNYFLHELFDESQISELQMEMHLFWLGLESAASVAAKFESVLCTGA